MSERKNLEESIAALQDSLDDGMAFRAGPHTRRVVDAACRHLETLPKPVWRVTATLPPGDGRPAAPYETTDRDVALDFARGYLDQGMLWVSVKPVRL